MKLKHLFLAALAVGTFASCSNDGDGLDAPVYKDIDTYISLTTTPKTTVTKASSVESGNTEKGSNGEQFIHTLTALVFDEADNFVTKVTSTSEGKSLDKIENIIVKVKAEEAGDISTSSFKVVLVANVANIPDPTSLEDFKSKHFDGISNYTFAEVNGTSQTQYLPMGSSVVTVNNLVAGTAYDNWIKADAIDNKPVYVEDKSNQILTIANNKVNTDAGLGEEYKAEEADQIALTRYVARVQLESLDAHFTENWSNAEFHLTNVALANVSNASRFVENESSFEYVLGQGTNGAYADNAFYRGYPATITRADYYLANGEYDNGGLAKTYPGITISNTSGTTTFKDATTSKSNASNQMAQFYAFEFDGYEIKKDDEGIIANEVNTLLIITGKISGVSGINPDEERSFRIPIKHDSNTKAVKRNYIYKVNATLTGTGTPNPDETLLNAFMSFTIRVEPWNVITQTEDDVN